MTVIIGMQGYPGVVLAADSEETVSGYSKREVEKVGQWTNDCLRFAIGGAGAGHYADMLADKIAAELMPLQVFDPDAISQTIEKTVVQFHQTHLWSRASSQSIEDAAVQLIIVVQPLVGGYADHEIICVWETCDSAVVNHTLDRHYRPHASIGIGGHLAEYLLDKLFNPAGGEAHLVLTAAYVLREVSKSIAQVGKDPYITVFRSAGTADWLLGWDLRDFDEVFQEYDNFIQYASVCILDPGPTRREGFSKEDIAKRLKKVGDLAEERWEAYLQKRRRIEERIKQSAAQRSTGQP